SQEVPRSPSTAEVTEMGGVIIPSANSVEPPIIAGNTAHFACLLTNAKRENVPPSPLLSAVNVRITYFKVVCSVSVQMIHDNPPIIKISSMILPLQIALNTYSGEVPISP